MNRRQFLHTTSAATAALAFPTILRGRSPNAKLRVALIGTAGRGTELAVGLAALAGVEVPYVCDVDEAHAAKAAAAVEKKCGHAPKPVRDFRTILEDRELDAVAIAAPDHWHAPAALLAMAAGKHVYVEKPCSHNPEEGEWLVAAARKHGRVVQHGTQRRSFPAIREAMEKLHAGAIGRVLSAEAFYFNARPTIGRGKDAPVPAGLDWALWQGPAPERAFRDNFVHYHWHWFWHWGTGELGNNGVHMIDVCRWGLGVEYARHIVSGGAKLRYDDDQETPDTNTVTFDFGAGAAAKTITWSCRSWAARKPGDPQHDVVFHGENGTLLVTGNGYTIHDPKGVEIGKGTGPGGNASHLQNFVDAIRGEAKLTAEIEEGHRSTLLCHLGNIAWRTQSTVRFDAAQRTIVENDAATKLWRREYREGWEPRV